MAARKGLHEERKGDTFLKICRFTRKEIEYCIRECNFTESELQLFNMRCKDIPLEQCAEKMNISVSTVKRISKNMKDKVLRVC